DMAENWLPSIRTLADMRNQIADMRRSQLRIASARNEEERTPQAQLLEQARLAFKKNQKEYEPMISSPEERKIYESIVSAFEDFSKSDAEVAQLSRQGNNSGAANY